MIKEVKKLFVKFNGREVGVLSHIDEEQIAFQYSQEWVENGFSISPFSLPLSREIYINKKRTFDGLYGVFHDSLPDGWGELLMARMLQKQGIDYQSISPLTKLTLVGSNGLGGLVYEPSQADRQEFGVELDSLAKQADELLNDGDISADFDKLFYYGGSSGGARPKAHIRDGEEEWIVKFPCRIDPPNVGEKEYQTNVCARECGLNVNEFTLFPSKRCSGYFGAKRFDRKDGKRVHMLSLSSILETTHRVPNLDYMHLMQVVDEICVKKEDLYEAFARMCFNVFYGNKDDHGKNFAFLYDEESGGYCLSPAYDLTQTPNKAEHEMTAMGAVNPSEKDLLAVAKAMKLSLQKCKKIMERCKNSHY